MKLQLQMFVYDSVDGTTATNVCRVDEPTATNMMKLQLQMFVQDRVDETTATKYLYCIGQG